MLYRKYGYGNVFSFRRGTMIIRADEIEFANSSEFYKFIATNDLMGIVQLKEPLQDTNGNLLIKDKIKLNENLVKRITNLEGKYVTVLKIIVNKEIIEKLALRISKEIISKIETQDPASILYHLFENNRSGVNNYKGIIENAFFDPRITLFIFQILTQKRDFFDHISTLGLYSLAAVIQNIFQIRFVNRFAFLTGLLCDVCLMDTEYWQEPITNGQDLSLIAKSSASYLTKYNLPSTIIYSISSCDFQSLQLEQNPPLRVSLTKLNNLDTSIEIPTNYKDAGTLEDETPPQEESAELIEIVAQALKIAKFISILQKKLQGSEKMAEKLITIFSYNTEKGFFRKDLADPMIAMFKEYKESVAKARRIASVENMCLYKPSAWAYPKPEPSQIICKNRVHDCPHIEMGWNLSVFSEKDALGYLGTKLFPGQYPKCKLEKYLFPEEEEKKIIRKTK